MLNQTNLRNQSIFGRMDWVAVSLYLVLVLMGWINIYAAVFDPSKMTDFGDMFSLSLNSGKQLLWIGLSMFLIFFIMVLEFKIYNNLAYFIYAGLVLVLIGVLIFGKEVAGSKSWFSLGFARIQPSEFAKFATALALAKYVGENNANLGRISQLIPALAIILLPTSLIILQKDTGSALVFTSFIIVLYREGLPQYLTALALIVVIFFITGLVVEKKQLPYLILGILLAGSFINIFMEKNLKNYAQLIFAIFLTLLVSTGVRPFVDNILKPHQQERIKILFDPTYDPLGKGWQVTQSKIAIGSGGFLGKGFLKGTQTKFDFVPDQSTDFIFCTIGEEWGWAGTSIMMFFFIALLIRLIFLAERQKSAFSRVYGYCVVAIMFFHFTINIGMTIGLFPVIGIPLPFFSYGGSSLWSFTILLFIMIKLDAHRMQQLVRE